MAGLGIFALFEDWLMPHLRCGALETILNDWGTPFLGPMLYLSGLLRCAPFSTSSN